MKVQLPIIYSQWDSRWASIMLGFNTNLPYNMYNYGCYVTAFAMACRYFGKDVDPGQLNQKLKDLGPGKGFTAGGGDYVPGGVNRIYSDIKELRTVTPSAMTDQQIAEIKTALDNGYPVLVGIDVNPRDVDYDSHFVAIVDYNPNDENDFTIADPLGGRLRSLKDYLGWFKPSARATIESYVICTGPKPKVNSETMIVAKADWEKLLRNSSEWDKIVEYLKPGADPKATRFEDLQTIVAGIKSRQTDLENQLNDAIKNRDLALKEIENQKDKLANVSTEYERVLKIKEAEISALKSTNVQFDKLRGEFEGQITDLQGKLREAQKRAGTLDLQVTALETQLAEYKKGVDAVRLLMDIIKGWFVKT